MVDLNKCFFGKGSILIFSGEVEISDSFRVETPGSNPIHGYDFLFPYWEKVSKIHDNSEFKAN